MNSFKPGDWVQHIELATTYGGHILKIEEIDERNEPLGFVSLIGQGKTLHSNFAKLWQPKPNEWCWFWSVTNFDAPTLSKFYDMQDKLFKCTNSKQNLFTHCEPFIGQLPTSIKDQS